MLLLMDGDGDEVGPMFMFAAMRAAVPCVPGVTHAADPKRAPSPFGPKRILIIPNEVACYITVTRNCIPRMCHR